jgi:hypothetical protein
VHHDRFYAVGGFPKIPLMENFAASRKLLHHGQPACLYERVVPSAPRWERHGVARTVLRVWQLRALFHGVRSGSSVFPMATGRESNEPDLRQVRVAVLVKAHR